MPELFEVTTNANEACKFVSFLSPPSYLSPLNAPSTHLCMPTPPLSSRLFSFFLCMRIYIN